jgi:mannose-6-phosphate isomerase-like protein (cupin superfamily)
LNAVLDLMRKTEQGTVYLSGTRLDNDFCFGSREIGILLTVMPEASRKASIPGYHPHSTETYVVFQGRLVMECLEDGNVQSYTGAGDEILIIPRGRCHRARTQVSTSSATLVVKTNLSDKPTVVRCDSCTYFSDVGNCPLHQRWKAEA